MNNTKEVGLLISVGVDVSKGKSTICILKPYGEVIMSYVLINELLYNRKKNIILFDASLFKY